MLLFLGWLRMWLECELIFAIYCVLLWFGVDQLYPYSSGLFHSHYGQGSIVQYKWNSFEEYEQINYNNPPMKKNITPTKQITTQQPYAFLTHWYLGGRCECGLTSVIFKLILQYISLSTHCEVARRQVPENITIEKSTSVQLKACPRVNAQYPTDDKSNHFR